MKWSLLNLKAASFGLGQQKGHNFYSCQSCKLVIPVLFSKWKPFAKDPNTASWITLRGHLHQLDTGVSVGVLNLLRFYLDFSRLRK